ncbi:Alpha/beta hydrolase [Oceanicaulis sp. 350]|nr:Alpha/beta hydrolase [Oceanicaulis sp. 350]
MTDMLLRILGGLILLAVLVIAFFAWTLRPLDMDAVSQQWMTEQDRFVTVDGEDWRVRESGPEDAPALVLIHGFSHSLEAWDAMAAELEADHRIIRFDLPGHGLTGPRADQAYSVTDTVAQVSALLDEIAPDRFAIGGNSLGGLVAWRYAADHPDRVTDLILIDPGGYPNLGVADDPAPVPDAVRAYLSLAPEAGVAYATSTLYADPSRVSPEQLERIRAMMRVEGNGQALIERIEQFTLPDPNPDLARIAAPTLIVWGSNDAMIPATHGPRFDAAIPNSRLVLMQNTGHVPMEEWPVETAALVRDFLND